MTFQYKLRRLAECIGQLLAVHLVLHLDSDTGMLRAEQHRVAVSVLCPLIGRLVRFDYHSPPSSSMFLSSQSAQSQYHLTAGMSTSLIIISRSATGSSVMQKWSTATIFSSSP